jgi:hypothetical protein
MPNDIIAAQFNYVSLAQIFCASFFSCFTKEYLSTKLPQQAVENKQHRNEKEKKPFVCQPKTL